MQKAMSIILCLALMTGVAVFTAQPANALTNQESYYLATLKPKNMPRAKESYPVRLIVDVKQAAMISPAHLEFTGSCGINAEVPDDALVELMKSALPLTNGKYKDLQAVCDDVVTVRELTEKLSFKQADIDEIVSNWTKMLGVDGSWVKDVLSGNVPEIGAGDVVNSVIDAAGGNVPMNPLPQAPGAGTVVNGVFISYEAYQKDLEKWDNIVSLSQTKARLAVWNSALNGRICGYLAEHGGWKITINSQDVSEMTYNQMPEAARLLWTSDIELEKTDSGLESITGTYAGNFKLKMDADFSPYDDGYAQFYADSLNRNNPIFAYHVTGNSGAASELKLEYEIPDCQLGISLPYGVNRHFFEESIPSSNLTQTVFTIHSDRMVEVKSSSDPAVTFAKQVIEEDGIWAINETQTVHYGAPVGPQTMNNNDGGNDPWPPDTRGAITMTLIIDMLGK